MIIKFWCWLWGHKTIVRAATGETYETVNQLSGLPETVPYVVLERKDFCVRCGTKVHEKTQ